ncbi:MAG: metal ABC transporter substrate-binding protein [Clostridium baratii]|uniref:Periplasmic solute binding family protein n=1 Tax=Clostridium baratii str. Sullivan TaxID=1415775 RepID=A0A0A7FWC9_9CLOT|nr:zinc ABC transporter substrate-binding protein [Clostridium baratii]AIY83939.1 periplasmic solute binding family protein [Clostridium baratii str. Sullivan]MBS6005428.1 metal ABC transporter substrate-binding protein [Clostridium baratii]MDU1052494.1 zinc ABC transporter substrate-binding protein [Clostridium baratii]MDU4909984.1 zinc ABC transporter substrate-binding protein [Clostridium baratii]CUP35809.1 ABC transporter substrate-binding protein [Clostridium baratii]
MKKITAAMLIITAAFFLGLGGFSKPLMADTADSDKDTRDVYLNIITTNKEQYKMIKELSKDKHNIEYMFNNLDEAKKYKYDENTIKNISNMDLFFYQGSGNENDWINELVSKVDKSSVGAVNLSRGIRELKYKLDDKEKTNPYYYLGIAEYKVMLYNAKSALQEKDPQNRDFYEKNYEEIVKNLEDVKKDFDKDSSNLKKYTFVSKDSTFEYLFKGLGIDFKVLDKNQSVNDYIKSNDLKEDSVIYIRNELNKDDKNKGNYKVLNLKTFDNNMSYEELISYNIKQLNNYKK